MVTVPYHTHNFTVPTATSEDMENLSSGGVVVTPSALGALRASTAEAQAGVNPTKSMTPLTTAQAIVAQVSTVGISGDYNDLEGKPTLGTASSQDSAAFATAAQGAAAATAMQPSVYDPTSKNADAFAFVNMTGQASTSQIANDAVAYTKVGTDLKRNADVTFTVGSGGQFSTINAALAAASIILIRPYKISGFKVEIRLLTGFQMAEQVLCKDVDLSYITITSVDPVVTIVRSALTVPVNADEGTGGTSIGHIPAFGGIRAKLPTIGCLFQMNTSGTATDRSGVYIANHSHISVIPNCGIQNAAHTGLFCLVNSSADAPKTIWKNAGNGCVRAESTSFIALASGFSVAETPGTGFGSDCSGSGGDGILCKEASLVDARAANVTGAANDAIHARRGSTINATQASASSTNMSGVRADRGSTVYFNLGVVTGAGTTGILCSRASRCDAEDAVVTSSADGIQAWQSSVINANNIVVTATAGRGVYALDGSTINARGGTANNCAIAGFVATAASTINCPSASATGCAIGINAREGSTINANGAVTTGHTSAGISSFEGSTINARGANARRAGVDTTSDFVVARGSILNFNNSKTGGVSQAVAPTITAEGIIFS